MALLETEIESLNAKPTESLEAYDFFLQGNEYLTRGMEINRPRDVEIAIEMYCQSGSSGRRLRACPCPAGHSSFVVV